MHEWDGQEGGGGCGRVTGRQTWIDVRAAKKHDYLFHRCENVVTIRVRIQLSCHARQLHGRTLNGASPLTSSLGEHQ